MVDMIIPAASVRRSAYLFNWGSILAVLIPFPLVAFWFGVSIFVYAFNKGHPDPRVPFFTQRAANRFYLMIGITLAIGKFTPQNDNTLYYYLGIWLIAVLLVMIPSFRDIYRIWHEPWFDIDTENPPVKEKLLPPVTFGGHGFDPVASKELAVINAEKAH